MGTLFALDIDTLIQIYKKLSPENLFNLLKAGAKIHPTKIHAIIFVLFMQDNTKAQQYQEKLIQSWIECRAAYPCPFTPTQENANSIFYEALKKLDIAYQIAGLHLMNKVSDSRQISHLLSQLIEEVVNGKITNIKLISVFASKLSQEQITTLIDGTQKNLDHENGLNNDTMLKFIAAVPKLNQDQITKLINQIQKNLEHESFSIRHTSLKAITTLTYKLNQNEIACLLANILNNLGHDNNTHLHLRAMKTIAALAPRLDKIHIPYLIVGIKNSLGHCDIRIRTKTLEVFIILIPKLNEAQLTTLFARVENHLEVGGIILKTKAIQAIMTLAPKLYNMNSTSFLTIIQNNLGHYSTRTRAAALYALTALAPMLNEEQNNALLVGIQKNLKHNNIEIRSSAVKAVIALASKCQEKHIATLFDGIQNNLQDKNQPICMSTIEALILFVPKLQESQITILLDGIYSYLRHEQAQLFQQELITLLSTLNKHHICSLYRRLPSNLEYQNEEERVSMLQAFTILASIHHERQLTTTILTEIQSDLTHTSIPIRNTALKALIALTPKLEETYIISFVASIENNLGHADSKIRVSALKAVIAFASKLQEQCITPLLAKIKTNLNYNDSKVRMAALHALTALASKLDEIQIQTLFDEVVINLEHRNVAMYHSELEAVINFIPKLHAEHIVILLNNINYHLKHVSPFSKDHRGQEALIALSPIFNETHSLTLFAWLNDKIEDSSISSESLSILLSHCSSDNPYASSIVQQLANTSYLNEHKVFNALGQLCLSWVQEKRYCNAQAKDLIESLKLNIQTKTLVNSNTLLLIELIDQLLLAANTPRIISRCT